MITLEFQSASLIALCGPSGSGKSYFAQRHFQPTQVVSSDQCRRLICDDGGDQRVSADAFDLFYKIIDYRLKFGRLTLADATNLAPPYRKRLIALAAGRGRPIHLVLFDSTLDECLHHNQRRLRCVEETVIRSQWARFSQTKEQLHGGDERYSAIYWLTADQVADVKIELTPP